MMTNTVDAHRKDRIIFTWRCEANSQTRGRRDEHRDGCRWMNIMSTSKSFPLQPSGCEKCRNRPRKDEGDIWKQSTLLDAKKAQEYANKGWETR
jgi:hypothetical protein